MAEKKTDYHEFEFGERIDNLNACSTTDCTGVVWRAPQSEDEMESYRDVYDFEPPYVEQDKADKTAERGQNAKAVRER